MNAPMFMLALCAAFAISNVDACLSSGDQSALLNLSNLLGVEPVTGADTYALTLPGYSDNYIAATSDLDCDFQGTGCKWSNMSNTANPSIDDWDWYLFERPSTPVGSDQLFMPRPLLAPRPIPSTAADGSANRFILAGSSSTSALSAVWRSSPIKCSENPTQLQFTYWMYMSVSTVPKLSVLLINPTTSAVLTTISTTCTNLAPTDGVCTASIPAQSQPYALAIRAASLSVNFIAIDDITYTGELGATCVELYNFENEEWPMNNTVPITTPITASTDLSCTDASDSCNWATTGATPFTQQTGVVDTAHWQEVTGTSVVPDGEFYMATGSGSDMARLESAPVDCLTGNGQLTFRAWMSADALMRVCTRDVATDAIIGTCTDIPRTSSPGPYTHTVTGDLTTPFRFVFETTQWSLDAYEGMVAVDDLSFTGDITCPTTTTTTTTTAPTGAADCLATATDFATELSAGLTKWSNYGSYAGFPTGTVAISDMCLSDAIPTSLFNNDGHMSLTVRLDQNGASPQVQVLQSQSLTITEERYVAVHSRRGVYGSKIWLCMNYLPYLYWTGGVYEWSGNPCKLIAGPAMTYAEWYGTYAIGGAVVPAGTQRLYLVFTHDQPQNGRIAPFMIDRIAMHAGNSASAPLAC